MVRSSINGGILRVRVFGLAIPKDFALIVRVLWRGRSSSIEYTSLLLPLPDSDLIFVLLAQEFVANTATFPPYVVKYLFNPYHSLRQSLGWQGCTPLTVWNMPLSSISPLLLGPLWQQPWPRGQNKASPQLLLVVSPNLLPDNLKWHSSFAWSSSRLEFLEAEFATLYSQPWPWWARSPLKPYPPW